MRILPAYERNPYLTELDAAVLFTGEEAGRPYALLDDTLLYPEGGGQPSDRGRLNGVAVLDVKKGPDGIRHYLAASVLPGPARLALDWGRRFDHMQQHTGQHLLTAVAQDRFRWATTAFHLGEARCDIELAAPSIPPGALEQLEEAVAAEIRAARAVSARRVGPEAYASMAVRSRGLPEGHEGDIRLVEIEGLDLNTCGGTHVRNTAELELVKLLGTEPIRGGTRLFYVAGGRARRRMEAHERRNACLRTLMGAPEEELVPVLEAKLEQLRGAERTIRALEEELAASEAAVLAALPGRLAEAHCEGRDAAFLQKVARQVLVARPECAVFLTAVSGGANAFVLAAGEASGLDVAEAGRELAGILGAKGGGAKGFFQGRAGSLAHRPEALARLAARISASS